MFTKKTYRKSRRIERIFEVACVPVEDPDSEIYQSFGPGWFTIDDKYIVSVFVKEALGDHTWWMPIKYMRMKGKETVGIITEHGNWLDVLTVQTNRFRVEQVT